MQRFCTLAFLLTAILIGTSVAIPRPAAAADDIINYSKHDERMNAAMVKARDTLPVFDAALHRPLRGTLLNVRVPYGASGNEYLWLTAVRRNDDGSYDGQVTDVVAHVPGLHQGSPYHAQRADVADWIVRDNAGDHGGWTVRVMREDMTPAQHAADGFRFVD